MFIDMSLEQPAMQVPSGWNRTQLTAAWWSSNAQILFFEFISQSLTNLSSDPDAISLVSGLNSAELTQLLCALMENKNLRSYS